MRTSPSEGSWQEGQMVWALGSVCALHRVAFDARLLQREFPASPDAPYDESTLIRAANALGFRVKAIRFTAKKAQSLPLPLLVQLNPSAGDPSETSPPSSPSTGSLALITAADADHIVYSQPGSQQPSDLDNMMGYELVDIEPLTGAQRYPYRRFDDDSLRLWQRGFAGRSSENPSSPRLYQFHSTLRCIYKDRVLKTLEKLAANDSSWRADA